MCCGRLTNSFARVVPARYLPRRRNRAQHSPVGELKPRDCTPISKSRSGLSRCDESQHSNKFSIPVGLLSVKRTEPRSFLVCSSWFQLFTTWRQSRFASVQPKLEDDSVKKCVTVTDLQNRVPSWCTFSQDT